MKYVICIVLLTYFFFTSGIAYEVFTPDSINIIETPYNIGLSATRNGVADIATEDDISALQWLKENAQGRKIVSDYNGYLLVHGFMQNHVDNLRYGSLTDIKRGDYIFLSSWNIQNGRYIEAIGVGLRESYELPDFISDDRYRKVYQCGDAIVMRMM